MRLRTLFFCIVSAFQANAADVALVDGDLGQAVLFTNRGLCYAVLPNHVSKDKSRVTLAVPAPAQQGAGEIFWRSPDMDLALAFVEGDVATRCAVPFTELTRDLSARLQSTETGMIKAVHFDGQFFDRMGAALIDVDDTFVTVRLTEGGVDAEVMQGLSGAMLSVGGRTAGIAIDAADTGEARFLRMDRISRIIGSQLRARPHPSQQAIDGFRVTGGSAGASSVTTLEPSSLAEPWITEWTGSPIVFEITLSNDSLVQIDRIQITSLMTQDATPARNIVLEVDRGLPGNAFWRPIAAPDMSPTGLFETFTGGTVARRLRIGIEDVWFPDRPLRIDSLLVE